jgi:hypothetical protein
MGVSVQPTRPAGGPIGVVSRRTPAPAVVAPTSDSGWLSSSDSISHGRFAPGTLLDGRYRIIGLLGKGGMGEVYRADDLRLGQPVALKFLPDGLRDEPVRLAQFHNERTRGQSRSCERTCCRHTCSSGPGRTASSSSPYRAVVVPIRAPSVPRRHARLIRRAIRAVGPAPTDFAFVSDSR